MEVWRRANHVFRISPAAVLAKGISKSVTYTPQHLRVGGAVVRGLVVGVVLFALPAAGAAAVVAFAISTLILGVLGLIGVLGGGEVSALQLALTVAAAFLAALFAGIVGAALGCLVGLLVGVINDDARGFSQLRRAATADVLPVGAAAAILWCDPLAVGAVKDELRRLGGEPAVQWPPAAIVLGAGGQAVSVSSQTQPPAAAPAPVWPPIKPPTETATTATGAVSARSNDVSSPATDSGGEGPQAVATPDRRTIEKEAAAGDPAPGAAEHERLSDD